MVADASAKAKFYTLDEANAALPLVRAIAKDMAELSRDVFERRERLAAILSGRQLQAQDPYHAELAQMEQDISKDGERLREYVEELRALGVEPKNGPEGLVDFPTMMEGRPAYLCWKLGEPEVLFWHGLEAGFAGRQPLAAGAAMESSGDGATGHES